MRALEQHRRLQIQTFKKSVVKGFEMIEEIIGTDGQEATVQ